MKKVSVTRMELLVRKSQLALAKQGRDLLGQKRTALMAEFWRIADIVIKRSDVLQQVAAQARQALIRANANAGDEAVRSAAIASCSELPLQVTTTSVMGVKVPVIEQRSVGRSMLNRGYSIVGTSVTIDEAAEAFEEEIGAIITLAEVELRLTRLAFEIQRTSRRLNALDYVLIPRLQTEHNYIQLSLEERERADHFRLKLVKRILAHKQYKQIDI